MKIDKTQYRTIKELDRLSKMRVGGYNPYGGKIFRKDSMLYLVLPYLAVVVSWPLGASDWQTVIQYSKISNKVYELVFTDDDSGIDYDFNRFMDIGKNMDIDKKHDENICFNPDYMKKLLNLFSINDLNPKMLIGNERVELKASNDDVSIRAVLMGTRSTN